LFWIHSIVAICWWRSDTDILLLVLLLRPSTICFETIL
jgi:hypothetical protein